VRMKEVGMKKGMWGFGVVMLAMVLLSIPVNANAGGALETIEGQVNKVLELLKDPAMKAESAKEAKEKRLWEITGEIFDYRELSRRTLGRNWKKLNAKQQEEFIDLFSKLLGGVYMDKILAFTDEKVVFEKESVVSETKVEVQSKIITASAEIPINYRMIKKGDEWNVYDVVIEGVSLVKNYRSQFTDILTNKTPEDLLDVLRKKVG
jgi:phospholipid transport system substrate-binding protein